MDIKGTELFVKALREEGVDTVFGYPGGMAIDLFDALYDADDIDVILPRHEQALVHEADGYARSTGKVGVCLPTVVVYHIVIVLKVVVWHSPWHP